MLAEAAGVSKIIIACGRTDLRKGIDGLAQLIGTKYDMNPFENQRALVGGQWIFAFI